MATPPSLEFSTGARGIQTAVGFLIAAAGLVPSANSRVELLHGPAHA
jgi:hypothetical protein